MRSLAPVAVVALLLGASSAAANGRFPATNTVGFQAGDAKHIIVESTFGVLFSDDDGATWRWECEAAVGYGGTFDPVFAASSSGAIFAGTFDGLSITRDGGCDWSYAGAPLVEQWISDLVVAPDGAIWVATATGGAPNDIYVSRDDGTTFAHTNVPIGAGWFRRVRVAPSDPQRVYASGYRIDTSLDADNASISLFYRSDDGGVTWTDLSAAAAPYPGIQLQAVLPTDPDVVFANLVAGTEKLLRSADGGQSWTSVVTPSPSHSLNTIVALPDGQHLFAPNQTDSVIFSSSDAGKSWTFAPGPGIVGAGVRSDGAIFACASNWTPDFFAVGRSSDGVTWTKVLRFNEIDGPVECAPGTKQHDMCEPMWATIGGQFGAIPDAAVPVVTPDAAPVHSAAGGKCGCGVHLSLVFFGLWRLPPWLRRRRRSAP